MNREHLEAVTKAFLMTVAGIGIGWMASRMYSVEDTFLRSIILDEIAELFAFPGGSSPELMLSFFIGFIFVTLIFFTMDWRKTISGILFGLFFVAFSETMRRLGYWGANVSISEANILFFVLGGGTAFLIQYRDLSRQFGNNANRTANDGSASSSGYEFNKAIAILPIVFGVMVFGTWVQTMVNTTVETYPVIDTVATFGFIYLMVGLVRYNQSVRVMPFGKGQVGKTVGWYGVYRAIRNQSAGKIYTSDKLTELDANVSNLEDSQLISNAIPGTSWYDRIQFSAPIGSLLPFRVRLDLPDMEGELSTDVARILKEWNALTWLRSNHVRLMAFAGFDLSNDEKHLLIAYWLRTAGIVTLFIDVKEFAGGDPLSDRESDSEHSLTDVKDIAEELSQQNVHLIPVAAKADAALDLVTRPDNLSTGNDGIFNRELSEDEYESLADEFEKWLKTDTETKDVLAYCDDRVYPTGVKMKQDEKGLEGVDLDADNNLQTFGFDHLSERIIEAVENRVRF